MSSGPEPCARFGHSCVPVHRSGDSGQEHTTTLVFTGGSDGNDLWRNGEELRDVSNNFPPRLENMSQGFLVDTCADHSGYGQLLSLELNVFFVVIIVIVSYIRVFIICMVASRLDVFDDKCREARNPRSSSLP
jgi:hypothetical protein